MATHDFTGDKGLCITLAEHGGDSIQGVYLQDSENELKDLPTGEHSAFKRFFVNDETRISKKAFAKDKNPNEEQGTITYIYDYPIFGTLYELHVEVRTLDINHIGSYRDDRKSKTFKPEVVIQNWDLKILEFNQ